MCFAVTLYSSQHIRITRLELLIMRVDNSPDARTWVAVDDSRTISKAVPAIWQPCIRMLQ